MRAQLPTYSERRRIVDAVHRNDDGGRCLPPSSSAVAARPAAVRSSANKPKCDLNRQREANTFRIAHFSHVILPR